MTVTIVACGALAVHVKAVARRRGLDVHVHPLPALLHNRPELIAPAVKEALEQTGWAGFLMPRLNSLVDIVVADETTDDAVKAIMQAARTGEIGDGRVFVLPVGQTYRIRTGEQAV